MRPTVPATVDQALTEIRPLITPLARAALDNGVSFEDVSAYVQGTRGADDCLRAWFHTYGKAPPMSHDPFEEVSK